MHEDSLIKPGRLHSRTFRGLRMNYLVYKKQLFAIVNRLRHFRGVLSGYPVTIVTDPMPLPGFLKSLQTNPMLIRWQGSLTQLDASMEPLEGKENVIADAVSSMYNRIPITQTKILLVPRTIGIAPQPNHRLSQTTLHCKHLTFTLLYQPSHHILICHHKATTDFLIVIVPEGVMKIIRNSRKLLPFSKKMITEPGL